MSTIPYEVRWIDDSKRYGLFATENIESGSRILHEHAVILDIHQLENDIIICQVPESQNAPLHRTMKSNLEASTRDILHGMQDLGEVTQDKLKYESAMKIHTKRMETGTIREMDAGENKFVTPKPWISMELYKQLVHIKVPGSEDSVATILQYSLQLINTYLHGTVLVAIPECHAWGPFSSFINHSCKPTALVSCVRIPSLQEKTLRNIGVIAVRSICDIAKDQEITIEYVPTLGALKQRRERLCSIGIAQCHCKACEYEERLSHLPNDPSAVAALDALTKRGDSVYIFLCHILPQLDKQPPVVFYQTLYKYLAILRLDHYNGHLVATLYDLGINYAKRFNDNVRILWIATFLASHVKGAYGKDHLVYSHAVEFCDGALNNTIWNADATYRDFLTLVPTQYEIRHEDTNLIFMLDKPQSGNTQTYHQLQLNAQGRLEYVSKEDNFRRVRLTLLALALVQGEEEKNTDVEDAAKAADRAAAELAAEEEADAARKEKKRRKKAESKKRQKERKKRVVTVVTSNASTSESLLTSVTTSPETSVSSNIINQPSSLPAAPSQLTGVSLPLQPSLPPPPKQPLPLTPTPAAQTEPPPQPENNTNIRTNINRVRSSSNPEPATVGRFFANMPLRPPPSDFRDEDCISDSEMEIRFGVQIWRRR